MTMNYVDIQACAGSLTEVGVPEKQARRFAEVMSQTFVQFSEHLVTSQQLDLRLFEQRAYMDDRFASLERQLVEQRAHMDTQLAHMHSRMVSAKSDTDRHLDRIDGKFRMLFFMVGLGFTVLIIPQLTAILGS